MFVHHYAKTPYRRSRSLVQVQTLQRELNYYMHEEVVVPEERHFLLRVPPCLAQELKAYCARLFHANVSLEQLQTESCVGWGLHDGDRQALLKQLAAKLAHYKQRSEERAQQAESRCAVPAAAGPVLYSAAETVPLRESKELWSAWCGNVQSGEVVELTLGPAVHGEPQHAQCLRGWLSIDELTLLRPLKEPPLLRLLVPVEKAQESTPAVHAATPTRPPSAAYDTPGACSLIGSIGSPSPLPVPLHNPG